MHSSTNQSEREKAEETELSVFREITVPKVELIDWKSRWFCYWDDSYTLPNDPDKDYVFKPPLWMDEADNFVKFGMTQIDQDDNEIQHATKVLSDIYERIKETNVQCGCFGSESEYPYLPFLHMSWDIEKPFNPENFLRSIGAHPELLSAINYHPETVHQQVQKYESLCQGDISFDGLSFDDLIFDKLTHEILNKLKIECMNEGELMVFYCGSEKLNPVPLFVICKFSPTIIGGFISAIVHT